MSGTIRATTGNGSVIFNARSGLVVKGDYPGQEAIDRLNPEATARNLGVTVDELIESGCKLIYCTFSLKNGKNRIGTPWPYQKS